MLAMIRGDAAEQSLFTYASAFVQARNIQSDLDIGSLIESPPPDCDPEILRRLRQMYEAGGWVLVESAIADLPADLRWLYESGAVTIEQLGALHRGLGVTSGTDLAAAVSEQRIRTLPGLNDAAEEAIAAALPGLRAACPAYRPRTRGFGRRTDPRAPAGSGRCRVGAAGRSTAPRTGHGWRHRNRCSRG